jgi:hypothetical protein
MRGLVVGSLVFLVAGCGAAGEDVSGARRAATDFYAAFGAEDGAAACALLAPETVKELEKTAKEPCDRALLEEDLPEAGTVNGTSVFGTEGRVVLGSDTLFLAQFGGTWQVVAAGCRPQGDLPYDCQIEGL